MKQHIPLGQLSLFGGGGSVSPALIVLSALVVDILTVDDHSGSADDERVCDYIRIKGRWIRVPMQRIPRIRIDTRSIDEAEGIGLSVATFQLYSLICWRARMASSPTAPTKFFEVARSFVAFRNAAIASLSPEAPSAKAA